MKLINKYKSPNYNLRNQQCNLKYVIIHYTAMKSLKEAINHLCDTKSKVSSHFVISKSGHIFQLVNVKYRAWHAGKSYWNKETDLNSLSIGIELDNLGYGLTFEKYTNLQILSLIKIFLGFKSP